MTAANGSTDDMRSPLRPHEILIQKLRSLQQVMGFVIGVSALMASTQPMVDPANHTAGITLAIVGIVSAGISMTSLIVGKVMIMLEATAVKNELMGK